jgi:hypothetical protein
MVFTHSFAASKFRLSILLPVYISGSEIKLLTVFVTVSFVTYGLQATIFF